MIFYSFVKINLKNLNYEDLLIRGPSLYNSFILSRNSFRTSNRLIFIVGVARPFCKVICSVCK